MTSPIRPRRPENANKLVKRDKVDVLVGTVHSGVALAMAKVARDKTLMIIPNAGCRRAHRAAVRAECVPHSFRPGSRPTRWARWSPSAATRTSSPHLEFLRPAVGRRFQEPSSRRRQGRQGNDAGLPFPNVEFQPFLTGDRGLRPDAVFVFFAGAGAAKFVRDYEAAGLRRIPLYGSGFLTDGTLRP